jgi:pyroglutamyl-peptidase
MIFLEQVLLITGFDPFGGATVNPSWEAVAKLPDRIGNWMLCKLQIPTVFGLAAQTVLEKAQEVNPAAILCLGVAAGRSAVTPERIGINVRSARIPDNHGNQPKDQPVIPHGPDGLFSTMPVSAMAAAIEEIGLPGAVSNTAGTFVCNDVLYTLLHHYHGTGVKVGFLHVPQLPEQGDPSLPLADTIRALTAVIQSI